LSRDLLGARAIREALDRHGVVPSKALGQNFVIDPNTIRKVLEVAKPDPDDVALEVGPGAGSLTLALAGAASEVIAIEKDARLLPVLEETLAETGNVRVVPGDVLETDIADLGATIAVANLPYNIAATTVIDILVRAPAVKSLTVMTQKEVGERLAAPPGSRTYGRTSVLVAYFGRAEVAARVSRRAFWPQPNVDSVIVRVSRDDEVLPAGQEQFFAVVRAAFATRRKTLRNALAAVAGSRDAAEKALAAAGVEPGSRAEERPPADFARIANAIQWTVS
jgi:16S rRNA (adenine1518-N6/adenine1519-N6)-dimethyltransferase